MVAQNIAKAKYIAATDSRHWCSESNNLDKKILADLHMKQLELTQNYIDNQTTISIANNHVFHGKTKQSNIKLYFLREV